MVTFFVQGVNQMNQIADCPVCGYPTEVPGEGQETICAYCNSPLIAQGITIPSGLFWGALAFAAGVFFGPVLLSSTKSGQRWLMEHAKAPK